MEQNKFLGNIQAFQEMQNEKMEPKFNNMLTVAMFQLTTITFLQYKPCTFPQDNVHCFCKDHYG